MSLQLSARSEVHFTSLGAKKKSIIAQFHISLHLFVHNKVHPTLPSAFQRCRLKVNNNENKNFFNKQRATIKTF